MSHRLAAEPRVRSLRSALGVAVLVLLAACSGGSRTGDEGIGKGPAPCSGRCQDTPTRLSTDDVGRILSQGVAEAAAQGRPATLVVTDRVGNVLAAYRMAGAEPRLRITTLTGTSGGLEEVQIVPAELGAIAKALTAAYFSSEGNAFTTRTANQIIQENFNPGEFNTPGGPLFGVQISQLPCSDVSRRFNGVGPDPGTHRSPIGFAADPGGLPLYKNGTLVGAVGVLADPVYSLDRTLTDRDRDVDELIATAATWGYAAPRDRRADVITVEGKVLRFADVDFDDLRTTPASAPAFATLPAGLLAIPGYTVARFGDPAPPLRAGTAFGQPESGVRPATAAEFAPSLDAFVLVDQTNTNRYPPRAGIGGLSANEVQRLLAKSIELANRTRSQVRKPLGSSAGIHVAVVDTNGDILGAARTRDALVDAIDVVPQKARSALFLSQPTAAAALNGLPNAEYLAPQPPVLPGALPSPATLRQESLAQYVGDFRNFLGKPTALADGAVAWSTRAIGNISRPFYPDDINGNAPGPLSKPAGEWSIFSTGLELDLVYNAVVRHLAFVIGDLDGDGVADVTTDVATTDTDGDGIADSLTGDGCTGVRPVSEVLAGNDTRVNPVAEIRNGITLFAGGFPIYRGNTLIGAIGLSGDGLEQDDFLPFLAVDQIGRELGTLGNAPAALRADTLRIGGVNLRYVICPQSPFLDSNVQQVCDGL